MKEYKGYVITSGHNYSIYTFSIKADQVRTSDVGYYIFYKYKDDNSGGWIEIAYYPIERTVIESISEIAPEPPKVTTEVKTTADGKYDHNIS